MEDNIDGACIMQYREEIHTKSWKEKLKGRDHSEDLVVDESVILEWVLGKEGGKLLTVLGQASPSEHRIEPLDSIKAVEYLD
jgi:hypothetical protein